MKVRMAKLATLLTLVSLGMLAAYYVAAPVGAAPGGIGTCLPGSTKLDYEANSYTISTPGEIITKVAIKAGTECFVYTADSSTSCYVISGIGTSSVTITRVGSGPTCKGISHVEYETTPGTTTTSTTTTTTTTTTSTTTSTTTPTTSTTTPTTSTTTPTTSTTTPTTSTTTTTT